MNIEIRQSGRRWELVVDGAVARETYGNRQPLVDQARELAAQQDSAVVTVFGSRYRNGRANVVAEWRYGAARTRRTGGSRARSSAPASAGNGDRRFGVEIEFRRCDGGPRELARTLIAAGVPCEVENYNHEVRSHWKIVTDSSCGYELVSPPLSGAAGLEQVVKACDALRTVNASQGSSCGTHVHVETTDLTVDVARRIVESYHNAQATINELVTQPRRSPSATYCSALSTRELNNVRSGSTLNDICRSWDRYRVVNFASFPRYRTVEFRQYHATRNGEKLTKWITAVIALVEFAVAGGVAPAGIGTSLWNVLAEHGSQVAAS